MTLRERGGGAVVVATVIVIDTTTMAPFSSVNDVAALIVAMSGLGSSAPAALAIGGLADPSMELL